MEQSEYEIVIHCDAISKNTIDRLSILLRQFTREEHLRARIRISPPACLTIHSDGRLLRIPAADLQYMTSEGHYCIYHTTQGDLRSRISFRQAAANLRDTSPPNTWLLINRGILVARAHITGHTEHNILMDDGASLPVRRVDCGRILRTFDEPP